MRLLSRIHSQVSVYDRGLPTNITAVLNSITNFEVDIASARRFVVTRFQDFRMALPAEPMTKALVLIEETWAKADLGQEVFWSKSIAFALRLIST